MIIPTYSFNKIINPPFYVKQETEEIMKRISNKIPDFRIVDFGAGTGRLTIPLLKSNFNIIAVDIDNKSLIQLRTNTQKIRKIKNLKTANTINRKNYYSYIVGSDILHHIDINKYFMVLYKALKYDGKVIFSEPNSWHIFWWFFVIMFLNFNEEKGIVHCNCFSLRKELKQAGFRNIKIDGFGLFPPQIFANIKILLRLNNILGSLPILKCFSFRLIIEASK